MIHLDFMVEQGDADANYQQRANDVYDSEYNIRFHHFFSKFAQRCKYPATEGAERSGAPSVVRVNLPCYV
jgi:hypothetical protein